MCSEKHMEEICNLKNINKRLGEEIKKNEEEIFQLRKKLIELEDCNKKISEELKKWKQMYVEKTSNTSTGIKIKNNSKIDPDSNYISSNDTILALSSEKKENVFWIAYNAGLECALWVKLYTNKKSINIAKEVCEPTRSDKFLVNLPEEFFVLLTGKEPADKFFYQFFFKARHTEKDINKFASMRR